MQNSAWINFYRQWIFPHYCIRLLLFHFSCLFRWSSENNYVFNESKHLFSRVAEKVSVRNATVNAFSIMSIREKFSLHLLIQFTGLQTKTQFRTGLCSQGVIFFYWSFVHISYVSRFKLPTPVLLPGKSHVRRSLVGYTVHGVAKSQTRLSYFTFTIVNAETKWFLQKLGDK